jgi:uncharacterized membrane protein YgdD (TMEM256/DUF423 family)
MEINSKSRVLTIAAGILGFLGVAIGAFGAHSLSGKISPEMMNIYHTGVMYHLIHAVVILAIGLSSKDKFYIAGIFFILGIILFSFSLYLYALTSVLVFAFITPFGGMFFLIGWLVVVIKAVKKQGTI